jgi:hypothetical protein
MLVATQMHVATAHRFKLYSCTARLTQLCVTWPIAEAAAKATGAEDNAAAELIFSGITMNTEFIPRSATGSSTVGHPPLPLRWQ